MVLVEGRRACGYKQCQHEIEARDQWGGYGDYLLLDRRKDVLVSKARNMGGAGEVGEHMEWMCDMRFESIRWLGISYNMFSTWLKDFDEHYLDWNGSRLVILDEEAKQLNIGSTGRWTKRALQAVCQEKIKDTWVGQR